MNAVVTSTAGHRPTVSPQIIESEVLRTLERDDPRRILLLNADPRWSGPPEIPVNGVSVSVRACPSLLAVLDAVESHAGEGYLVVLTPCDDDQLGASLLSRAVGQRVRPIRRWDLVRELFGARVLDHRLRGPDYTWLPDALLEAAPPAGWDKLKGTLLDLDAALTALTTARLSLDSAPDVAGLLDWTQDPARIARYASLRDDERNGIRDWLVDRLGPVAHVVLQLVECGHASDVLPLGLLADVLFLGPSDPARAVARGRALERYFGGVMSPDDRQLAAFREASASVIARWQDAEQPSARFILDRAMEILTELQGSELAAASPILESGYVARCAALGTEIGRVLPAPRPGDLAAVEEALEQVLDHRYAKARAASTNAATMAVRLLRWLAASTPEGSTLGDQVNGYVRDGAWVDRAWSVLWPNRTEVPAYERLLKEVRDRRDAADKVFAQRLSAWTQASSRTERLVLVENLLERVVRPIADRGAGAPLLIVLDGMSAAIACQLAESIGQNHGWTEIGRSSEGREGGLATIPSVTNRSRVSLLSGMLTRGDQRVEQHGFAAFWGSQRAQLFHKGDLRDGISDDVQTALQDLDTVVGVVVNAIDESLDHGRESGRAEWGVGDIDGLEQLLTGAALLGRPVVLTSDHGHVLDRGEAIRTDRDRHARYRTGEPDDGEISVAGPRVLAEENQIVVPWNERIRYSARQGGYHGGVSLAEMVIPILTFVSDQSQKPGESGESEAWEDFARVVHQPEWWSTAPQPPAPAERVTRPTKRASRRKPARTEDDAQASLDLVADAPLKESLGRQVVESEVFSDQGRYLRAKVPKEQVATLIDALAGAGGKLAIQAAARESGQPLARMNGFIATVKRLLNVESYAVLDLVDDGRTVNLDLSLLREQFLSGGR